MASPCSRPYARLSSEMGEAEHKWRKEESEVVVAVGEHKGWERGLELVACRPWYSARVSPASFLGEIDDNLDSREACSVNRSSSVRLALRVGERKDSVNEFEFASTTE